MIVVCTGCSAKFRVADEKVGPRGAKLRCSKCQTVFTVQQQVEVPAAPEPAPDPGSFAAGPVRSTPPPLPRRATTTLDARAAFDVDLEPDLGGSTASTTPADPFAPPAPAPAAAAAPPADPFAAAPPASIPDDDPFASLPGGPAADPFGAAAPEPVPAHAGDDFGSFHADGPAAPEPHDAFAAPAQPAPAPGSPPGTFGLLSLEDATTPPARRISRAAATEPAPVPLMPATEDPFGGGSAFDAGLSVLDEGVLTTAAPSAGGEAHAPVVARRDEDEPPLQLDPFGAAAVAADPLAVGEPLRAVEPQGPIETTAEHRSAARAFRIRDVLVSAMALAALLLLAMAILVIWRGGLAPGDALRPAAILRALSPRPPSGVLAASGVTSGLYERGQGAPLLFVRGTVTSTAPAPLDGVRVIVEVVRDGAVLVRGEVPVGAVPGPEALHGVADQAGLDRALAEAATAGGTRLAPGGSAPFLIAFADYPANLEGASLRVRTVAGPGR